MAALIEAMGKADPAATFVCTTDEHKYTQATVTLPSLDGLQLFVHSDDWVRVGARSLF
jgi:hypothetical protein